MHEFDLALQRPDDYFKLSAQEQWDIDKRLGILDWDGSCAHKKESLCVDCRKRWNAKWKKKA